eukprot:1100041-Amphidinium_carterae.2
MKAGGIGCVLQVYADDIYLIAASSEQTSIMLAEIARRLDQAGFTLNAEKSQWFSNAQPRMVSLVTPVGVVPRAREMKVLGHWL